MTNGAGKDQPQKGGRSTGTGSCMVELLRDLGEVRGTTGATFREARLANKAGSAVFLG